MSSQGFRDLEVWQKSMKLVTAVYILTETFPKKEIYSLSNQICRAAVSIPSNIAEGRAKRSTRDYIRFLNIAYGSAAELETQLEISFNLKYATSEILKPIFDDLQSVCRMINGLIASLERKAANSSRALNPESRIPEAKDA